MRLPDQKFWKGKRVLDVGCGTGNFAREIAKKDAKYVLGIDYADEAIKNNRLFDYSGTKQAAQTFSIEAAKRHESLYEKAKGMSVNIEDYKDVAQDTVQIPENMLDFIGFKVKNLFI